MGPKLSKKDFLLLTRLLQEYSWLREEKREEALIDLLGLCDNENEKSLIPHIIERFTYVEAAMLDEYFDAIISQIRDKWALDLTKVQLVATTIGSDADSAQAVLWMLKRCLGKMPEVRIVRTNRLGDAVKKSVDYPLIVLIDEFVGTGNTFAKRARDLRTYVTNYYAEKKIEPDYAIYGVAVASMKSAIALVNDEVEDFFAPLILRKGISDHFVGKQLRMARQNMTRLESELEQKAPTKNFPTFGYGQAEALYGTEFGNMPNSVFPIFWWPYLSNMKSRITLFHRDEVGL